jgi:hypothetical protein
MEEKDVDYRDQLKSQLHSNGYLIRMNSKDKFALLNVNINKDRIAHF